MHVHIDHTNISEYQAITCPNVTEVTWKAGPLCKLVLVNLPNLKSLDCTGCDLVSIEHVCVCPKLEELFCSKNRIETLGPLKGCPLLRVLNCKDNMLASLEGLERCTRLVALACGQASLVSLRGVENCTELIKFDCADSNITTLKELAKCRKLRNVLCSNCKVTSTKDINKCPELHTLCCQFNQLAELNLEGCTSLEVLACHNNRIRDLGGIKNCLRLTRLSCDNNMLTMLDDLIYHTNLKELSYSGNHIGSLVLDVKHMGKPVVAYLHLPPKDQGLMRTQTDRVIERVSKPPVKPRCASKWKDDDDYREKRRRERNRFCIEPIQEIIRGPKPEFAIGMVTSSKLSQPVIDLLVQYCNSEHVHPVYMLTFAEVFAYIWARIVRSVCKDKLLEELEETVQRYEERYSIFLINKFENILASLCRDIDMEEAMHASNSVPFLDSDEE